MENQSTTIEIQPSNPSRPRWRPGLAAAAAVLLVVITFLGFRNDGGFFGLFRATPVEIAESYMEARDAWDVEKARSLLAADVVMADVPLVRDLGELGPSFEFLRIIDARFPSFECTELRTGPPVQVGCTYLIESVYQRVAGSSPDPGSFRFLIADGKIMSFHHSFNFTEISPDYEKFLAWLDGVHPGEYRKLFRTEGGTDTPILTSEALDLLRQYTTDYEASVNG